MTAFFRFALAALSLAAPLAADSVCVVNMPCYYNAGVVNSASYATGWFAANTFVSIFGWNLSYVTAQGAPGSEQSGLGLGGVQVVVNNEPSYVSYISPNQINFVIPTDLTNGASATIRVYNNSLMGPSVTIALHDSAPAMFLNLDGATAVALHANGTLVTLRSPAQQGERVKLFATGLGPYETSTLDFSAASPPNPIARRSEFAVLMNGAAIPLAATDYVGITTACVGLVEVNFQVPSGVGRNPEIRLSLGGRLSPPATFLPVE